MSEEMTVANKEKLVTDLKVVISDTEELLRATAGAAGEMPRSVSPTSRMPSSTRPRLPPVQPTISCMNSPGRRSGSLLHWASRSVC